MAHPRKFRFGIQVTHAPPGESWGDYARRIESLGFSSVFLPDHFGDQLAPMPALAAAAEATTELRVGALVLDNDYKHPVIHAKELASIDVLSGGRLEVGLGAGWMRTDYDQAGLPYDPPKVRVDRFEEALTVIKGLFGEGPVNVSGEHYTITDLEGYPKPVQKPGPPFLIGAGGPRMLAIAAREADIVGVNPNLRSGAVDATTTSDATPEAYDRKLATLRAAAGERFADLELNALMFFVSHTDRAVYAETMAPLFGFTPAQVLDTPMGLFGTEDEMCEQLEVRRDRWGLSYIVCQADTIDLMAPVVARLTGT